MDDALSFLDPVRGVGRVFERGHRTSSQQDADGRCPPSKEIADDARPQRPKPISPSIVAARQPGFQLELDAAAVDVEGVEDFEDLGHR